MFNVPIPDGTTAHAVGGVLIAVLLGPWAAVVAVSVALLIQALFFGDGGVLAYGANAFNMAFVMPFVGYAVYRVLARRRVAHVAAAGRSPRASAATSGINAAALCAAIEFGAAARRCSHTPPTARRCTRRSTWPRPIPAMLLAHLAVAGVVEVRAHRGRRSRTCSGPTCPVLRINHDAAPETDADVPPPRRLGLALGARSASAMVALTPLGLLAPGGAFGEDAPDDLDLQKYHLDAVPSGLRQYAGFWHNALLRRLRLQRRRPPDVGYFVSAVVGIARHRRRDLRGLRASSALVHGVDARPSPTTTPRHRRADRDRDVPRPRPAASHRTGSLQTEVGLCPCGCIGRRRKGSFVEKTIDGGVRRACARRCSPTTSPRQRGLLQRIDPRVKLRDAARPARRRQPSCASIPVLARDVRRHARARGGVSRLSLRVLRQAGVAVRPDLHRHRRAAGHAQLRHARRHRRAARHVVRPPGRHDQPGAAPRPASS